MNRNERKEKLRKRQEGEKLAKEKILSEANKTEPRTFKQEIKVVPNKTIDFRFIKFVSDITDGFKRDLYTMEVMESIYRGMMPAIKSSNYPIEYFQRYEDLVARLRQHTNPDTSNYLDVYKETLKNGKNKNENNLPEEKSQLKDEEKRILELLIKVRENPREDIQIEE